MCEDSPCCGCCGSDYGDIYSGEYALDDHYDSYDNYDLEDEDEDDE